MQIIDRPPFAQRTTLRLGGTARAEIGIERDADWEAASRFLEHHQGVPMALGRGSNLLAADGSLPHILVRDSRRGAPVVESETDDGRVLVRVAGGISLPRLLGWLQARGLSGLEGLAGIPGTVGGAVAMNAGSYGVAIGQAVRGIEIWTPKGGVRWLEPSAWEFSYRRLGLMGLQEMFHLITAIRLQVVPGEKETIRRTMLGHYTHKRRTQPVLAWTCGCVFCNPSPDMPAGKLLDSCGLRGMEHHKVAFSERHANFLINLGGGSSAAAWELIETARQAVAKRYSLALRLEVRVVQ